MKRRAAAITALALPAIIVVLVAIVLFGRERESGACPELDVRLGETALGPRGWTANARYEQWPEDGQCLGSLGVSFFAPGESWEDEAWAPAAHAVIRHGLLPPPTRERAWLSWSNRGRAMFFGFGRDATLLVVDSLPDTAEGLAVRRCAVHPDVRIDEQIDWASVEGVEPPPGECVALPVE